MEGHRPVARVDDQPLAGAFDRERGEEGHVLGLEGVVAGALSGPAHRDALAGQRRVVHLQALREDDP